MPRGESSRRLGSYDPYGPYDAGMEQRGPHPNIYQYQEQYEGGGGLQDFQDEYQWAEQAWEADIHMLPSQIDMAKGKLDAP